MSRALQAWSSMSSRSRFFVRRLRERLWVKPLMICLLSIAAAFTAGLADQFEFEYIPEISRDSIETLLSILSASMLVIAVFAVGAMLAAYASASNAATPRTFPVVVSDDVSQNALSTFIGSFIFSIIAQIALMNGYYEEQGLFTLFLLTVLVFSVVILGFVRWVDRIARLGRLGSTIDKVEAVAINTLKQRAKHPTMRAAKAGEFETGAAIYADRVGYVQHIDVAKLQGLAEQQDCHLQVAAMPGSFASPGQALAYISGVVDDDAAIAAIKEAFILGGDRTFDEDPRFGLVVLAEIASRALSPAVNDPGTAIDIIGTLLRMIVIWTDNYEEVDSEAVEFNRIAVPELTASDMMDDAFNAIARDGAGTIEVALRLQKTFEALALLGNERIRDAASEHADYAFRHAELALKLPEDIAILRSAMTWKNAGS